MKLTAEQQRLYEHRQRRANWKHWGPYLSERAWGTVREDYSATGEAWGYFPHDHARSRAYRWNEDGLAGISDRNQYLCFALALWNGQDAFLKERLFGVTGLEGNHGEDVKEYYFYLDNIPTHSYMKMLYKYPQQRFPYTELVEENRRRGRAAPEFELLDTGIFAEDRYFDVVIEYAKASEDDILIRITATNRGPDSAPLVILPTLWFRNTWSWGYPAGPMGDVPWKPEIRLADPSGLQARHPVLGTYWLTADGRPQVVFTENETNMERLYGVPNSSPYVKDAFHRYLIDGEQAAVDGKQGTKATTIYPFEIAPRESVSVRLRLSDSQQLDTFADFEAIFEQRIGEADEFYATLQPPDLPEDDRQIQRQALAGMLWSKQLYYYDIEQWQQGDPVAAPPPGRKYGRNHGWEHLNNFDIISMPDKWEYPWYASWDLAFHCVPLALVDPDFAKRQLELMTREWYMHPNGQLPAYEWALSDVNPPVHAWAVWQVYWTDAQQTGVRDRAFLEGLFHKLLLNFTWWVNRKDEDGRNVFQGGFLGLDNISVFDRNQALPTGGHLDQADGTAWMAFYSLGMVKIALELARDEPVYQDIATKFFEHFLRIAQAMTDIGGEAVALWDQNDRFFYDAIHLPDGSIQHLRVRSLVGLIPLIAVETLEQELLETMPDFSRRMQWFVQNRPHLSGNVICTDEPGAANSRLLALLDRDRLVGILRYLLDEEEFLSLYGIRSLSKAHRAAPFVFEGGAQPLELSYQPAESQGGLFGGNSNWRGPVWFPLNYLIIQALHKFHDYYGDGLQVECPTGSGQMLTLEQVAEELARRLVSIFQRDAMGHRPVYGGAEKPQYDEHWRDLILFYEYFHGDNGAGLGASHQTGWTGLVSALIQRYPGLGKEQRP